MATENRIPALRRIAETPQDEIAFGDLVELHGASVGELSFVAEHAADQEPPNSGVMAIVGAISAGRLMQCRYLTGSDRDLLKSATNTAFPSAAPQEMTFVRGE